LLAPYRNVRLKKLLRNLLKKKLKIEPIEPLASSKANRRKGKAAIIAKAKEEVIVRKPRLK